MELCQDVNFLKAVYAFKNILTIISIITPLILVIALSIEISKVIPDVNVVKSVIENSKKRIIAALMVLFVPIIINLLLEALGDNTSFSTCYNNANLSTIENLSSDPDGHYIELATDYLNNNDCWHTYSNILKIKDTSKRQELFNRYNSICKTTTTTKPENTKTRLNVNPGQVRREGNSLVYYLYIPNNPTTKMPLLLWLHGDNPTVSGVTGFRIGQTADSLGYPVIVIQPYGGSNFNEYTWSNNMSNLRSLIDNVCNEFECDTNLIVVGGHSRGAIATWQIVSRNPNYFHAAAPVSCCYSGLVPSSFKDMKVWAFRGTGAGTGYNNDDLYRCMQNNVNAIESYVKDVKYTIAPNTTHIDAQKLVLNRDFFEYIFSE